MYRSRQMAPQALDARYPETRSGGVLCVRWERFMILFAAASLALRFFTASLSIASSALTESMPSRLSSAAISSRAASPLATAARSANLLSGFFLASPRSGLRVSCFLPSLRMGLLQNDLRSCRRAVRPALPQDDTSEIPEEARAHGAASRSARSPRRSTPPRRTARSCSTCSGRLPSMSGP